MSLDELRTEQETASKLKRDGGNAVHEFRQVALRRIEELVGSPAGVRLQWYNRQTDSYESYKLEGRIERGKWYFSGMHCGSVSVADLDRGGSLQIDILGFALSPSPSGYELEIRGNSEGESYKARVPRSTLPILLHATSPWFEYRCLWSNLSDNDKIVQAIWGWLAGEEGLESDFILCLPPVSKPSAKGCSLLLLIVMWSITLGIFLIP
jgi:hypothetical protein